ncbi:MAG: hypothetical protein K6E63_03330, partial [Lachnospiraceae bacterium]|nr:hypothetical protein [Lachnospiraceae bacterium]
MNELVLEISAFCISLFCLTDCLRNRTELYLPLKKGWVRRFKDRHFVYLMLLVTMMISALSSVLEVAIEHHYIPGSIFGVYLLNQAYFVFHTALPLMFSMYINNLTGVLKNKGRTFFLICVTPLLIGELIILTNPFTKIMYSVDSNMTYSRGPFMWLIYAIALMYVAFGVIYFFRNTSILSELDRSATIVLVFIAILG